MLKKWIAILLCVASLAALTACGKQVAPAQTTAPETTTSQTTQAPKEDETFDLEIKVKDADPKAWPQMLIHYYFRDDKLVAVYATDTYKTEAEAADAAPSMLADPFYKDVMQKGNIIHYYLADITQVEITTPEELKKVVETDADWEILES